MLSTAAKKAVNNLRITCAQVLRAGVYPVLRSAVIHTPFSSTNKSPLSPHSPIHTYTCPKSTGTQSVISYLYTLSTGPIITIYLYINRKEYI